MEGIVPNLVMFSLVPACAIHQIQWVHVSAIYTQLSTIIATFENDPN